MTATARKIAVLFCNAVRHGMTYQDQGAAAYDERHRQRVLANLQRRAQTLGHALAPVPSEPAVSQEGPWRSQTDRRSADPGESVSKNRVARMASLAGIAAQVGYRRRPGRYGGKPAVVAGNRLDQQVQASRPDQIRLTDITPIKTHEGRPYLCVGIDPFSRRVAGWSAQSRRTTDLALQARLMAA